MKTLLPSSGALAISALLGAQSPATKAPSFHLPAGEHSVERLLQHAELAVRRPIDAAPGVLDGIPPVRLQHALALPPQAWQDALAALLAMRGLVLVHDEPNARHEVRTLPSQREPWLRELARPVALDELRARPDLGGLVRVPVPATLDAQRAERLLAMSVPGVRRHLYVDAAAGEDRIVLAGVAATVRAAIAGLARFDRAVDAGGVEPAPAPWPRAAVSGRHRLAAGTHRLGDVIDHLAAATGRNLVLAPGVDCEQALAAGQAIDGDAHGFEDAVTALLWTRRLLVVDRAAAHGIHEVVELDPRSVPAEPRATATGVDELLARPGHVAFVRVELAVGARHPARPRLDAALQRLVNAGEALDVVLLSDRAFVVGISPAVRELVEALDPAPAAGGRG